MSLRSLVLCGLVLGTGACGPMPGYYVRHPGPPVEDELGPKGPPEPPPEAPEADEQETELAESPDEAPEVADEASPAPSPQEPEPPRPPRPPRRVAPDNWTPPPGAEPAKQPTQPSRPSSPGFQVVELDKDSSYLIDEARGLCFFRHREALAPVDCAKLRSKPPAEAPAKREPSRPPSPAPTEPSGDPTPDELVGFEAAFTDIYCDRISALDTPPESRITGRKLSVKRYEDIETWWASDEKAWLSLTQRAAAACKR